MAKPPSRRYLTKSRYNVALLCPTRNFYAGKRAEYADSSLEDPFLRALARGGYQVGALAKLYFPSGVEVTETDHDRAVAETDLLLASAQNVTIFEAAFRFGDLFVRVDVFRKQGNYAELIEVKSKSIDPDETPSFVVDASIVPAFRKYVYDVAFQTHVTRLAKPDLKISSSLMLVNKTSRTTVAGLNQLFLLRDDERGRPVVIVKEGLTSVDLGREILIKVSADDAVSLIVSSQNQERGKSQRCEGLPFSEEIEFFAQKYVKSEKIRSRPGHQCRDCEFRATPGEGQKSGFAECWLESKLVDRAELNGPFVFDLWNFRKAKKLIEDGKVLLRHLSREDINPVPKKGEAGLSLAQRHWMQIEMALGDTNEPFVDSDGLAKEMTSWVFPLHLVDFETVRVAVPFTMGRRPYEQVAFQFSHHILHEDGRVEHATQYLNDERGVFPNYDFVRRLKDALSKDQGTIFQYSHHENTTLCEIWSQLSESKEPDAADLMAWIETITVSAKGREKSWSGPRLMVDMWDLVKRYFYHPLTHGSTSIKKVLPAVIASSEMIKTRYSKPIYGARDGISSHNFRDWVWVEMTDEGIVKDPYERLGPVWRKMDGNTLDRLFSEDELANGGAAMVAYAAMQFAEMGNHERAGIRDALLRYCELDTFAMVLVLQYWIDAVRSKPGVQRTA